MIVGQLQIPWSMLVATREGPLGSCQINVETTNEYKKRVNNQDRPIRLCQGFITWYWKKSIKSDKQEREETAKAHGTIVTQWWQIVIWFDFARRGSLFVLVSRQPPPRKTWNRTSKNKQQKGNKPGTSGAAFTTRMVVAGSFILIHRDAAQNKRIPQPSQVLLVTWEVGGGKSSMNNSVQQQNETRLQPCHIASIAMPLCQGSPWSPRPKGLRSAKESWQGSVHSDRVMG